MAFNQLLIAIIVLYLFNYTNSSKLNPLLIIISHGAFACNLSKNDIKIFHPKNMLVLYKSICWTFIMNADIVKVEI